MYCIYLFSASARETVGWNKISKVKHCRLNNNKKKKCEKTVVKNGDDQNILFISLGPFIGWERCATRATVAVGAAASAAAADAVQGVLIQFFFPSLFLSKIFQLSIFETIALWLPQTKQTRTGRIAPI